MPQLIVNLDALIPREDFQVKDQREYQRFDSLKIADFEANSFTWSCLRKPLFQRETANWSPQKVHELVTSFLNGDFVPNVILWRVGETLFVIDGAHRLSAIAAWVQDDYGVGDHSRKFFKNHIPPEQEKAAARAKTITERSFRTYKEHLTARDNPDVSRPEVVQRLPRFGSLAIGIQWVPSPDAGKAEASFFKINQQGTALDKIESLILKTREAAQGIAARTIVRNATGHEYWSFPEHKVEIEKAGREIYQTLFNPPIPSPLRSADLPPAGRGYGSQTLPIAFDLVHLANKLPVIDATKAKKKDTEIPADKDGSKTVAYLKEVRRVSRRLSGRHPSSLGLHPAIYFYSSGGRHQPTALYAMVALLVEWEQKTAEFEQFTRVRARFEDFLKKYKTFVNQVTGRRGSGAKGYAYPLSRAGPPGSGWRLQ